MKPGHGRRWLVGAVGLFLFLFVLWVLAVFQLSPASAGPGVLQLRLRSNLAADYTAAPMVRMLRTLRLTVMQDVMQDMGMTDEEASAEMRAMARLLESPVPTATARDLMGEAPFTPTATRTPVPTDTPEPTATSTPRPRPTATETEKPTKKPKTATAEPSGDDESPQVCCLELDPEPGGELDTCRIDVLVMRVYDEAPSAGVEESKVKVKYRGPSLPGYVFTGLELDSGGWTAGPGSTWDARYSGRVDIEGVFAGEELQVWGYVEEDIAGNGPVIFGPLSYEMTVNCD